MQDQYKEIEQDLNNYYNNEKNNIWKNKFHIEMPFGLVNDPNGLSYYNNKFHIFYQWNPFGCEHKTKHWGLVKTSDFVNFTKPKIVLKPEDWFDKDGCYSGGAFVKGDVLKLFYTGNVKGINNERQSYQCIVDYNKDDTFKKRGPIINKQPDGYTAHFRDPMIFTEDGIYYMILGIQTTDLKGRALIYKSRDIEKWDFAGELKTNMKDFGYMWECPNMIKVSNNKYAFIFSPQGLESEEFKYQNIYQSGYVIGNLDLNKIELKDHSDFKEIDMGFDFYAPQVFNYDNSNVMLGWIGLPDKDCDYPTSEYGWMYPLTMPRVLRYENNSLYQRPLKELENLRESIKIEVKYLKSQEYKLKLDSRSVEIKLDLDIKNNNFIELILRFKDEYIALSYNKETETFIVDRNHMELGAKGIRKFKLKAEDLLNLHMFIDSSVIEIYYQDGIETTTIMYFPKFDELQLEVKGENTVEIDNLCIWSLRGIKYE